MTAASSTSQQGLAGTTVANPPAVTVRDQRGTVMANVVVTFTVTAGGGSISPASVTTDANGVARATLWTLGTTPGENSVSATSGTLPPVQFSATAAPAYTGPLIDTHLHLGFPLPVSIGPDRIGWLVSALGGQGVTRFVGFHFIGAPGSLTSEQSLQAAKQMADQHPGQLISFFQPNPGNPSPWLDPDVVREILQSNSFFRGYGELPLYRPTFGSINLDSPELLALYPVMAQLNRVIMMHPKQGQWSSGNVFSSNSDVVFLLHGRIPDFLPAGQQGLSMFRALLSQHANVYFTLDMGTLLSPNGGLDHGASLMFADGQSKAGFLAEFNTNYDRLLEDAVAAWKVTIEEFPDRLMWGTDLAPVGGGWHYDDEIIAALVRFSRQFVNQLKPEVQEKFAYRNAEILFD